MPNIVTLLCTKRILAVAIVFVYISISPHALAERDALVNQAAEYLRNKEPQKAFDILAPKEVERSGDPDFDLAFGVAANQTKRYTLAIMAFERVLQVQPNNASARAELARVYYAVRDNKRAKELLKEAKAIGVPTQIGRKIDQFIDIIENPQSLQNKQPKRFSFGHSIYFDIGQDNNINRAPSKTTFKLPGISVPLPIAEEGKKVKSSYFNLGYSAGARYEFNQNWAWTGTANINTRSNSKTKRLDTQSISASTGGSYSKERHHLNLLFHTSLQMLDGKKAATNHGISGSWGYHIDGFRQISSSLGYFEDHNHINRFNNSKKISADISYSHMLRTGTYLFAGLYTSIDTPTNKRIADKKTHAWGLRTGVQHHIRENLSLSASVSYENRAYKGIDPTFKRKRNDKQYNFQTSLSWSPWKNVIISPGFGLEQSHSNIDFYSFKREHYSISTRYIF